MKEIKAIIQPYMLDSVCSAVVRLAGVPGLTVSRVRGFGRGQAAGSDRSQEEGGWRFGQKTKVEIVVADDIAAIVVDAIERAAHTGKPGDGKIFVTEVSDVVKIRTGERGQAAIKWEAP